MVFSSFMQMIFMKFQQSVVRFRKYQLSVEVGLQLSVETYFGISHFLCKNQTKYTYRNILKSTTFSLVRHEIF